MTFKVTQGHQIDGQTQGHSMNHASIASCSNNNRCHLLLFCQGICYGPVAVCPFVTSWCSIKNG